MADRRPRLSACVAAGSGRLLVRRCRIHTVPTLLRGMQHRAGPDRSRPHHRPWPERPERGCVAVDWQHGNAKTGLAQTGECGRQTKSGALSGSLDRPRGMAPAAARLAASGAWFWSSRRALIPSVASINAEYLAGSEADAGRRPDRDHILARNPSYSGLRPELSESGSVYRKVGGVGGPDLIRQGAEVHGR